MLAFAWAEKTIAYPHFWHVLENAESPTIRILTSTQGNSILYAISNWLIKVRHTKRINCASLCTAEKNHTSDSANRQAQISSGPSFQTNKQHIKPKSSKLDGFKNQKLEHCSEKFFPLTVNVLCCWDNDPNIQWRCNDMGTEEI